MSILNNSAPAEIQPANRAANQLKQQVKIIYYQMVEAFNVGAKNFWNNPRCTPQEIAVELGTDAKEVFELHAKLGALLATINPESISPGQNVVGQFTINQDGTVTIPIIET